MHDIMGSAGMLRGWVAMWSMHVMWLLAGLTASISLAAAAELFIEARVRRGRRGDGPVA